MSDYVTPRTLTGEELDNYLSAGWYRMHQSLFTDCMSWIEERGNFVDIHWLRFPLNEIWPHRSHRRIRKKNRGFRHSFQERFELSEADEQLYQSYKQHVPFDAYESIAECLYEDTRDTIFDTKGCRIYDQDRLIALTVFDLGKTSAASIIQCYHPDYARYSPGKYMILLTLDYMRAKGLRMYYPGHVMSCKKRLDYKLFLGLESAYYYCFESETWERFRTDLLDYKPIIDWDEIENSSVDCY